MLKGEPGMILGVGLGVGTGVGVGTSVGVGGMGVAGGGVGAFVGPKLTLEGLFRLMLGRGGAEGSGWVRNGTKLMVAT